MTAVEAYEECRQRFMEASWQMHDSAESLKKWRDKYPVFQEEFATHVKQLMMELISSKDPAVWHSLGDAFAGGYGVKKDMERAVDYFSDAAQFGHTKAMVRYGNLLQKDGSPENQQLAISWFQKSAEAGDTFGMTSLGFVYREGQGVPVDPVKAAEWFSKAVDAGNKRAKFLLAKVYYFGLNATDKALPLLLDEAERQNTDSFKILGQLYGDDRTNFYDFEKAVYWYERIVNGDYEWSVDPARIALAKLYLSGKRQPKNLTKAKQHLDQVVLNSPERSGLRTEAIKILEKIKKGKI